MNKPEQPVDIAKAFADDKLILRALKKAVREAMIRHRQAGCPVVVWRNGKSVWIPPEDIRLPGEPRGRKKRS
jgi:hypothetical protein